MFNLNNQKINLLLILLFSGLIILLSPNWVKAADCGGATSCYCGDTVVEDATITEDLNCDENVTVGLTVMANLYLQANITMANTSSQALVIGASGTSTDDPLIIQGNGTSTITGAGTTSVDFYHIGVLILNQNYITISNLNLTNFNAGIGLSGVSSSTIENNTTTNNNLGIGLDSSNNNTLTNNTANNNTAQGIYLSGSSGNELTGNYTAENGEHGIYIKDSTGNTLTGNTMSDNHNFDFKIESTQDNIEYYNQTIDETNLVGGKPIYYLYQASGTAQNPLVYNLDNQEIAFFWCFNCEYVQVKNATLSSSTAETGIYFWNVATSSIENIVANNFINYGIYLRSSTSTNLTGNTTNYNAQHGIYLISSDNNTLTNNTANNNTQHGIDLENSSNNNTLTNNTANSNAGHGILLSSSSGNELTGNYTAENGQHGIWLASSDSNTLTNNYSAENAQHGIYLIFSDNNTLTNNTANNNTRSGIYFDSSSYNTSTSNTVNNNTEYGIYLYDSSCNNTLDSNTANHNTWSGIYLSSNNTSGNQLRNNKFIQNQFSGFGLGGDNSFSNNQFIYNFGDEYNNNALSMLSYDRDTINNVELEEQINFTATMLDINGSTCANCSYEVNISPSEPINISKDGAQLTVSFTPRQSGLYSLIFLITDPDGNIYQRAVYFFVEATGERTVRYYLRGVNPTHGQPADGDAKSLLLTEASEPEEWGCAFFIQASPDEIPETTYYVNYLSNINFNTWYKAGGNPYVGVERSVTYDNVVDVSSAVPAVSNYTWVQRSLNVDWLIKKPWEGWYDLAIKLIGNSPYWITFPTEGGTSSYVDFTYQYSTTPAVRSVENYNIVLLSATADPNNTDQVSLILENPLDAATSTNLVLDDFHQAFLTGTAVIDSTGSTTLNTGSIDAGATTSFASVPLFLTPSAGSVSVVVNTWQTSDTYYKQWTETGSQSNISTAHTVGDLKPNTAYVVKVDNSQYGVYTSNSQGEISFTYSGGYSSKTFEIVESTQGAAVPPPPPGGGGGTTAATTETNLTQLQDEINRLTSLINWLKAKLAEIFGGAGAATVSIPEDCQFTATLKYGDTNNEVKCLQLFLKSQGASIYPEGKVTGYFGSLTKNAVMRFQEKYVQEILTPAGFTKPTGIVGKYTNAKIRQILGK